MFYRLRDSFNRAKLNRALRPILNTKPHPSDRQDLLIFSAVSHRDLLMYLAAVKSLAQFLPAVGIVAMNDGSLTADDQAILNIHLPGIRIVSGRDIYTGKVPADTMWQRMFWSIKLAQEAYVIQLDSDTLTLARPDYVIETIAASKSFILGTRECQAIERIEARSAAVSHSQSNNIQTVSERAMRLLSDAGSRYYVRGSAGFYGFAPHSVRFEDAENIFIAMDRLTQGRFVEYGSEQFAANFLVANTEGAVVLPFPTYAVHDHHGSATESIFLHFIGSFRYYGNTYFDKIRYVNSKLNE